jgi:hypothetical protein
VAARKRASTWVSGVLGHDPCKKIRPRAKKDARQPPALPGRLPQSAWTRHYPRQSRGLRDRRLRRNGARDAATALICRHLNGPRTIRGGSLRGAATRSDGHGLPRKGHEHQERERQLEPRDQARVNRLRGGRFDGEHAARLPTIGRANPRRLRRRGRCRTRHRRRLGAATFGPRDPGRE